MAHDARRGSERFQDRHHTVGLSLYARAQERQYRPGYRNASWTVTTSKTKAPAIAFRGGGARRGFRLLPIVARREPLFTGLGKMRERGGFVVHAAIRAAPI